MDQVILIKNPFQARIKGSMLRSNSLNEISTITAESTLDEKVQNLAEQMASLLLKFDPFKIAVAWTGGKDSTVVLAVWREILKGQGNA